MSIVINQEMFLRIFILIVLLTVPANSEIKEKLFEIQLRPCNEKSINSKFKDPNFYHPITFDINFNNEKYRKPINLIKACTRGKKLMFISSR